jgi:hypothetical protein
MKTLIIILFVFFFISCTQKSIPPEFVGTWTTEKVLVTVRTESEKGKFMFATDSALIKLIIKRDKTADGFIGIAEFKNGTIKKNWGNPEKKGISYKIKCGSVGKFFSNDPLENKEVEIWLGPLKGTIDAELRYTEGGAYFPMAGMILTKGRN